MRWGTLGMYRFLGAAAALLCIIAIPAFAEDKEVQRNINAAPGTDVNVGMYTNIRPDCTAGPLPAIRLVRAPTHGRVNVKQGNLKGTNFKQCLAFEGPALVAFYRAAENYSGSDEFVLEVTGNAGRRQVQHFRVTVSSKPDMGENI
jgi:hypothetical protein